MILSVIKTYKILISNGVNLDLLGTREPSVYGHETLDDLEKRLRNFSKYLEDIYKCSIDLSFFQTNDEASYLDILTQVSWDGCVLNPGAWTHTSLALGDRLKALRITFIEVHLSNIYARESYRHHSYLTPHAAGVISGLGMRSYLSALLALIDFLHPQN